MVKKQLLVLRNGWALGPDASDEVIKEALSNAAHFQSQLQAMVCRSNASDVQMAGTRRAMCEGSLIRSFPPFRIHMPYVVDPALDVEDRYLVGSIEWDSGSDQESQSGQVQMEQQKKKAKKDAAADENGHEQDACGPTPKPN